MESSHDGANPEGHASKPKPREKNRKPKRPTQEMYVPRARRQNTPTGESTASHQQATQAAEKPQGVQLGESSASAGEKQQQQRKSEQRKGREGGKGRSQRDRNISTEGKNNEVKEHKGQGKGKHGRKGDQPRHGPKLKREDDRLKKNLENSVQSENANVLDSKCKSLDTDLPSEASAKPTLPKQAAEPVKTASPVPEDWNEIDYDEREVTCHPTGTRLTSRGRLIPVNPHDDTVVPPETLTGVENRIGDSGTVESVETGLLPNRTETKSDVVLELESENCTTGTRNDSVKQNDESTPSRSNSLKDNVALKSVTSTERMVCKGRNIPSGAESVKDSETISSPASKNSFVVSATDQASSENVQPDRETERSVTTAVEPVSSQSLDHQDHDQEHTAEGVQSLTVSDKHQENRPTSHEMVPHRTDVQIEILGGEKPILDNLQSDHERYEETEKDEETVAVETADASHKGESVDAGESDGGDDWDALFDESGDCLKPEELEELSEGVGNVQVSVKQSKRDYYHYQPKDNTNYSEFEHVIEVYDFPADFKTQDLITGFSNMKTKEMDIKWIDDTHALAVFPSCIIAQDALSLSNPMFRTRPLMLASREAKMKARACEEFLLPSKPRPETSASTARRLVSGALGLKADVSKEQRAAEKQKIKDAKERKRIDKKQQEDIWSGNI